MVAYSRWGFTWFCLGYTARTLEANSQTQTSPLAVKMYGEETYQVYPYTVPHWAAHLNNIPKQRVKLATQPTPIHKWNLSGVPDNFTVHIKRDDLTGAELTGNKVRPLEFVFADALAQGCRHVVAGGQLGSSNSRMVALIAAALGMTSHLLYAAHKKDLAGKSNVLLARLAGSRVYLVPPKCGLPHFQQRLQKLAEYVSSSYREPCYHIALGSSSIVGVFGYISAFQELIDQGVHDRFDDVIVTLATAGTVSGLAIGNYLTGSKLRIHAVIGRIPNAFVTEKTDGFLDELGLTDVRTNDIINIIEGYQGEEPGHATDQLLEFIASVCASSGILLDPVYTGKTALAMVSELSTNPDIFKGKRVLFYHTGGMFGLFDGEIDRILDTEGPGTTRILDTEGPETTRILDTEGPGTTRILDTEGPGTTRILDTEGPGTTRILDTEGPGTTRILDTEGPGTTRILDTEGPGTTRILDTEGPETTRILDTEGPGTTRILDTKEKGTSHVRLWPDMDVSPI